eukprot:scaffold33076_cov51-Phaeocystis_antarctica.AAC.1
MKPMKPRRHGYQAAPVVPRYAVRKARPRLVRVRRTYRGTTVPCASGGTLRRRPVRVVCTTVRRPRDVSAQAGTRVRVTPLERARAPASVRLAALGRRRQLSSAKPRAVEMRGASHQRRPGRSGTVGRDSERLRRKQQKGERRRRVRASGDHGNETKARAADKGRLKFAAGGSPRRPRGAPASAQLAVHCRRPAHLRSTTPRLCGSCAAALVARRRSPARGSAHTPAATTCGRGPWARYWARTRERHSERAKWPLLTRPT